MHTSRSRFVIVLEGLPASGKTTLADHLAAHDGFMKVNESLGMLGGAHLSDDQRVIFDDTLAKYSRARERAENAVIVWALPRSSLPSLKRAAVFRWPYAAQVSPLSYFFPRRSLRKTSFK